jgi:serine/threonine protein kinase
MVGTLRYMAPERFAGKSDARADVYGLGLTLYELLLGRPAFDETDRNKLIKSNVTGMLSVNAGTCTVTYVLVAAPTPKAARIIANTPGRLIQERTRSGTERNAVPSPILSPWHASTGMAG